jgi:hypothetical protein
VVEPDAVGIFNESNEATERSSREASEFYLIIEQETGMSELKETKVQKPETQETQGEQLGLNHQQLPTNDLNRIDSAQIADLEAIAKLVRDTANQYEGQTLNLLALLRMIEALHQEIRDELFQKSLPDNRQALYALLRDIEASGGWPYIHRMKLQAFLAALTTEPEEEATQ